ncbi:Fis family transcriptional regulator [Rhizobium chutanense]|uniref:Fis family transcriptional regulator n=1 Tax=Rhizobium chutanense TaxID=2035448 RepID=A0A2A6JIS3_9HYPH|nr:anti-sigma factor [Rhizobium chutanense]PDT05977.1 Fis family transcriptional regulator [Rhizobium chutanense]
MPDLRKLPLEAQLTALLDGEVSPEQRHELEQRLADDENARRLHERLRHGADFGRRRLDDILKEPVPLALVRSIKSTQPPKTPIAQRATRPQVKLAPSGPQALAAALILFAVGCGIGYFVGISPDADEVATTTAAAPANTNDWLGDVTAYQRLLIRQPRHLVEVPASQAEEISSWLTTAIGVPFRVPDLSAESWTFQGARVILGDSRPVGQLVYSNADGDVISICFRKDALPPEADDFKETIKDEIGLVTWHNAGTSYVLAGPSAEAALGQLAMKIATAI